MTILLVVFNFGPANFTGFELKYLEGKAVADLYFHLLLKSVGFARFDQCLRSRKSFSL